MWSMITGLFSSSSSNSNSIYAILFGILVLLGFVYDYTSSKVELQKRKDELVIMSAKVEEQNNAIKALEIDVETYKNKEPQVIEKIVTKYNKVVETKTINTCENLSEGLYNLNSTFFKGNKQ